MADFDKAFNDLLGHEGGYVNDADDPGGETYKGIARERWSEWDGWALIDSSKSSPNFPSCLENDEYLQSKVKRFYKDNFWDRALLDNVESQLIAEEIFDTGVNQGLGSVIKYLQQALNRLNNDQKDFEDIAEDGVPGPQTLGAFDTYMNTAHWYSHRSRKRNERVLLKAMNILQGERYFEIVRRNPSQEKFFYGWISQRV